MKDDCSSLVGAILSLNGIVKGASGTVSNGSSDAPHMLFPGLSSPTSFPSSNMVSS
jgi:hypothetical protein